MSGTELEVAAVVSGKSTMCLSDVEKRKSFADMKLVDFTPGSGSLEVRFQPNCYKLLRAHLRGVRS